MTPHDTCFSRREFLALAAGAAVGSCGLLNAAATTTGQSIDAGPVAGFAKDGVYDEFRSLGFFVVRRGPSLFALSSICTHRAVQVKAMADCSFYCKRHGSTFSPTGKVTEGPARRDLPMLSTSVNGGHLIVTVAAA